MTNRDSLMVELKFMDHIECPRDTYELINIYIYCSYYMFLINKSMFDA